MDCLTRQSAAGPSRALRLAASVFIIGAILALDRERLRARGLRWDGVCAKFMRSAAIVEGWQAHKKDSGSIHPSRPQLAEVPARAAWPVTSHD